ncbi:predicted protein [Nematostella vectensis]|uniref:Uncharacterized protein n=1 Tax=Nematostella vectensis TaxID=45351 RepID=A7RSB5_NEMVE|nr:uncharacterized protein LOC5517598 [Nematostella vectensis]EDO45539.1 predicted protein [Nematostella vectensis]|eukprot:XP_001637602.1 predicted protein [Nematostella vectensis]
MEDILRDFFNDNERYIMATYGCDEDLKPKREQRDHETYSSCCYSNTVSTYHALHPGHAWERVHFLNLRSVYEKVQCRKNKHSKQRITQAIVDMMVTYSAQIQRLEVYVERIPEAAKLCGDHNGQVPLKPRMDNIMLTEDYQSHQYFSVDLDSIYESAATGCPVYKLSTVDSDRRNRFRLVVYIVYLDGTRSNPTYSLSFLLRSKRTTRCSPF